MKVILQQDVKKLGKKGDIIEVAEGYARNFLFPRNLAQAGNEGNVKVLNEKKASLNRKEEKVVQEAKALAERLEKVTVVIPTKVGEGGRLYGSVNTKDVADALQKDHGIKVDKRKIELNEAIKSLGVTNVTIKLHPKVQATFKVQVTEQ